MKLGINITGAVKVFAKEYNGKMSYQTSIGSKKQDGTWENMFISLQIKDNPSKEIEIIKGFLSFYTKQDGTKVLKLVVTEYVNRTEGQDENLVGKDYEPSGFVPVEDTSDLPF